MTWELAALSTLGAVLPMLFFLGVVWWLDRYDREPLWLVGSVFLWGAIGATGLTYLLTGQVDQTGTVLVNHLEPVIPALLPYWSHSGHLVVVSPLVEELAKGVVLLLVMRGIDFDNMTDGFVYGAAVGLGFAMTENFLYYLHGDPGGFGVLFFTRTFYSAVMHAVATACVGAALGYGKFRGWKMVLPSAIVGFSVAIFLHGLWNGLMAVTILGGSDWGLQLNLMILPIEVILTFGLYQACLYEESQALQKELREEASLGLIPSRHVRILASWWRRTGHGWVPEGVPQWGYIHRANRLAMLKSQVRRHGERVPKTHRSEITRLRQEIRLLFDPKEPSIEDKRPTPVTMLIRNVRPRG